MKIRWISTIVLIVMFFAVTDISYCEDEQQCQPDVIVFFGNGVGNHREAADKNRILLQLRLNKHISGTSLDGKITYELAHNPSEGTLEDLFETFEQNIQTEKSKFWRFLASLDLMPDILQDKLKEIATEVDADIVSANPSIQEHIDKYNTYLKEGNVVVLVAHSQGNLYGNIAHLGLDQQYIAGFGIVSVANPDSYIAGGGPYTTIEEDYIISPLQYVYPFALPPNLDNFTGPVNLADWSGHKFIESYMASGHSAETVILDNVANMINELSQPLSSCNFCIDFTADVVVGASPLIVEFTPIPNVGYTPTTWYWRFGDGSTSSLENPSHDYKSPGTYTVTLRTWSAEVPTLISTEMFRFQEKIGAGVDVLPTPGGYDLWDPVEFGLAWAEAYANFQAAPWVDITQAQASSLYAEPAVFYLALGKPYYPPWVIHLRAQRIVGINNNPDNAEWLLYVASEVVVPPPLPPAVVGSDGGEIIGLRLKVNGVNRSEITSFEAGPAGLPFREGFPRIVDRIKDYSTISTYTVDDLGDYPAIISHNEARSGWAFSWPSFISTDDYYIPGYSDTDSIADDHCTTEEIKVDYITVEGN